jgi:lipopolysaccharide biosynthesis protein
LEPDRKYGYAYLESVRIAQLLAKNIALRTERPSGTRLAIIIHAFYPDVLELLLNRMPAGMKKNGELFITTIAEHEDVVHGIAAKLSMPFEVFVFPNLGRDVLPFLKVLRYIKDKGFTYLLKLHTKKSLHREDGDKWRDDLYAKLLDDQLVERLTTYFTDHPEVGLIGPEGYISPLSYYWGSNEVTVRALGRRLGIGELNIEQHHFIAGTMFFARICALEPLLHLALSDEDFEPEQGQVDGTLAHAIERVIALCAFSVQMSIVSSDEVIGEALPKAKQGLGIECFYQPGTNHIPERLPIS